MADTQPSNSELSSAPHLSNGSHHLETIPVCHECGIRFENFNSLYHHIDYYHKNQLPLPRWHNPQIPPHTSDPNSNFKSELNYSKPESIFSKSDTNDYNEPGANNFPKSEHENFIKPDQTYDHPSEPNYTKPGNHFPYKNSIKSEQQHQVHEEFPPHYDESPVQSPHNNHRDFTNGNGFPGNGFSRPKNGAEDQEAILDLDSQRVHVNYQPPGPQIPPPRQQKALPFKPQVKPAITPSMEDAYDTVSTTTTSPPDPNNPLSPLDQPYPKPVGGNSKSGGSWKSNEARRPKTYLCAACNKWFTSSGHLKRHYNTTLHKNAVKQSGQPDPCTLPVSTHHHPYRDPNFDPQAPVPPPRKSNGRASNNFNPRPNGTPTPDPLSPEQQAPPQHITAQPQLAPPQHMMPPPTPPNQSQSFTEPPYSPKVDPSFYSPSISKDPSYALNNNYPQDPPNLMAGPSETSEGLLPPPPPTSYYPQLMPLPSFQPQPPTSIHQSQNFLPLTTNYPNFQAPHVSSTHPGTNINLIGNQDVLGQHVDEKAFIPLLMQATRDANTFFQLQKQYAALNIIPEEYVGGLPSPQDLDFSTDSTNPESSGTSFNNDTTNVSSTSFVNYSFQSNHTSSPSALSPDSAFSPSCSFDNNNVDSTKDLEIASKPILINSIKTEMIFPESTTPDENSSNVITSTNGILNNDSLLSPNSFYEEDPLTTNILRCDDCDKVFNKSCYLKQHNGCFHSGEKPYKCPRCGKRFVEKAQCEKHLTKHGGDKPHKCEVCPKSFHHKTDLRRHSFSHNAEKPYTCPLCGKGFIRKDHMLKHTNIHKRKNAAAQHVEFMTTTVSPV
ncbi:hypothetical protein WDU94_012515 [Cyamophila willieti]